MIKIHQRAAAVTHSAINLFFEAGFWSKRALGRHNLAWPEPAAEQVKEMHAMLDKNAAAFTAVPEPVLRGHALVAGVIFKIAVEEFT